ncbi:FHA domain-containing protein [Agromyces sp. NPDC056965]|uniref:FHA domain-containing protein n=1 Tax=Agromyces sp. NPDC056965 TaxID=3345983 RepID=UPI003633CAE7
MFCTSCGQLVPQSTSSRPPAPFSAPPAEARPAAGAPAAAARGPIDPVPLPSLLPWQQAQAQANAGEQKPTATGAAAVVGSPVLTKVELSFSTGQRVVVSGAAVIGRKPAQTAAATGAQSIELLDDTRSVSRVHLYFALEGGAATVADAGSSNGSSIERAGAQIPLQGAGSPVAVVPGDRVWVGDISFEIRPAA